VTGCCEHDNERTCSVNGEFDGLPSHCGQL